MTPPPFIERAQPIKWPLEAIWQAISPTLPGFTAEVLPEVDSTNSELMRRLRGSAVLEPRPEPTLLVAEQQTAGRGRLGRPWHSQRGACLTFSLSMPLAPANWSGLSLAVGVAVADALEPLTPRGQGPAPAPRIGLKWPNDLWLTGSLGAQTVRGAHKLGGILVETATVHEHRYVVIGVGINIAPVTLPEPSIGSLPAGHLQQLVPGADAAGTLLRLLPALVQTVQAFESFGFVPFQARFARRDVLQDCTVVLSDGLEGMACGVDEKGALLVHTSAGMKEISSSEVSVRPKNGEAAQLPGSANRLTGVSSQDIQRGAPC